MTSFVMQPVVPLADDSTHNAALGVNAAGKLTDKDIGKALKLLGDSRYGVCSDGDEIEAVLLSVEPFTVNDGLGFGTIQTKERFVATNGGAGAIAVGAYVIAAAQPAVGTAITPVSSGTATGVAATPVKERAEPSLTGNAQTLTLPKFNWRVVSLLGGNGGVGTNILIERVV